MAWSTRELALLAGTTVRAVRHYHRVGLLDEPQRLSNGYKQYGVSHLERTLRIRRLTDLGFSLAQVAELGDADRHPQEALRHLHTELAQDVARLQRARGEVARILAHAAPTDLAPELSDAVRDLDLTDADRSLVVVVSRVLPADVVITLARVLHDLPPDAASRELDELAADADEATRQDLARRLLPRSLTIRSLVPGLPDDLVAAGPTAAARRAIHEAIDDLYNPAQVDVLRRVRRLRTSRPVAVVAPLPTGAPARRHAPARSVASPV